MSLTQQLAGPVKLPVRLARALAPAQNDVPVYVVVGALTAAGVLEWPAAVTIGLGYTALRRWGPRQLFTNEEPQIGDDLVAEPVDAVGDATEATEVAAGQPAGRPASG